MRFVVLILALAAVAFAAKYALEGAARKPAEHTAPRQQLDNVRDKAHQLEKDLQKAADDAAKNTDGH